MKTCPNCGNVDEDYAKFCTECGTQYSSTQFESKEVSDNRVICMLVYLLDIVGVLIGLVINRLMGRQNSEYVSYHVKNSLKITILEVLAALIFFALTAFLSLLSRIFIASSNYMAPTTVSLISAIVGMVFIVCLIILFIVRVVCFVWVCRGKYDAPPVVRSFRFLH